MNLDILSNQGWTILFLYPTRASCVKHKFSACVEILYDFTLIFGSNFLPNMNGDTRCPVGYFSYGHNLRDYGKALDFGAKITLRGLGYTVQ